MAARRWRGLVIAWKAFSYTLGALVIAFVLAQLWFYGHIVYWSRYPPESTAFMERSSARLKHQWVPYERISVHLKRAVVAAEDARFLDHEGFDWDGIQKAYEKNVKKGKIVSGGSTISQQLANEPGGSLESGRYTRLIRPLVHAFLLQYGAKPGRKRPSSR